MIHLADSILNLAYFSGYTNPPTIEIKNKKTAKLKSLYEVIEYSNAISNITNEYIDHIHIKSKNSTGNTLILVLNHYYQYRSHKFYKHLLDDGLDILLYNPTQISTNAMATDLKTIIDILLDAKMHIVLYGYCMGCLYCSACW